jgi:hypothetical protein
MNKFKHLIMRDPLRSVVIIALIVILITGFFIMAAWQGWPADAYQISEPMPTEMSSDSDIEGRAWFDKQSYFMGEVATFDLRVRFREGSVEPDFDTFRNYISFQPFEQRKTTSTVSNIGGGIQEYRLRYELQAMGSKLSGSYGFNPTVLYYKKLAEQTDDLYALRIQLPQVYVASYYPFDITGVALHDIKSVIVDPAVTRQVFMLFAGIVLASLTGVLLWVYGRRRRMDELSVPERLWRRFNEFRNTPMDNRAYLLSCERIFSGLLSGYVQTSPEKFWSGVPADYGNVSAIVPKVRVILRRIYKISDPAEADVEEITILIEETLSSLVEEEKLKTEMEPTFIARIRKQPRVIKLSSVLALLSVMALFLAYRPLLWLSPDIVQYNQLVTRLNNGIVIEENPYTDLTALGEAAELETVRAAAFYNAGTIRVNQSFASTWLSQDEQREQHELVLRAVFQRQSAETFLNNLTGRHFHTENELVVNLTNGAEHLLRAELDLQAAVRAQPDDEQIGRNLELAAKRRYVLLRRLVQIRDYYEEKEANREKDEMFSDTGLIDIINAKVPEEFEDEETRSDDTGYMIFERF